MMSDKFLSKHTAALYYTIIIHLFFFVSFGYSLEVYLRGTFRKYPRFIFYGELKKTMVHLSPIAQNASISCLLMICVDGLDPYEFSVCLFCVIAQGPSWTLYFAFYKRIFQEVPKIHFYGELKKTMVHLSPIAQNASISCLLMICVDGLDPYEFSVSLFCVIAQGPSWTLYFAFYKRIFQEVPKIHFYGELKKTMVHLSPIAQNASISCLLMICVDSLDPYDLCRRFGSIRVFCLSLLCDSSGSKLDTLFCIL